MSLYLVAAYSVLWAFTSVLVLTMWVRQQRIEREIAALRAHLDQKTNSLGQAE